MVRNSPFLKVWPAMVIVPAFSSIFIASQPTTQGLPQPRATTAAWLALPPVEVRIPLARCMPATSSGLVSLRTSRIGSLGCALAWATASSADRMILPEAAPGLAAIPRAIASYLAFGSSCGRRRCSRLSAATRLMAVFLSILPSLNISTAIRTAEVPVRLPVRVWSMYRVPSCTVNSMSCISL